MLAAIGQLFWPFYGRLRSETRLQLGLKLSVMLATSTFVVSILDVSHYTHIPQAFRFHYNLCSLGTRGFLARVRARFLKSPINLTQG